MEKIVVVVKHFTGLFPCRLRVTGRTGRETPTTCGGWRLKAVAMFSKPLFQSKLILIIIRSLVFCCCKLRKDDKSYHIMVLISGNISEIVVQVEAIPFFIMFKVFD